MKRTVARRRRRWREQTVKRNRRPFKKPRQRKEDSTKQIVLIINRKFRNEYNKAGASSAKWVRALQLSSQNSKLNEMSLSGEGSVDTLSPKLECRNALPIIVLAPLLRFLQRQVGDFVEIKRLSGAPLENVQHVLTSGLEVSSRIIRTRNEYLGLQTLVDRFEDVGN